MVQATTDSSGRLEFHSDFKVPTDARLKIEGLYPNADMNNSQIAFELTKNCECGGLSTVQTAAYSVKYAPGMQSFMSMHNLMQGLSAGFEATFIEQLRDWKFAYGFRYSTDQQMLALKYNPLQRKEILNLGYLFRVRRREG